MNNAAVNTDVQILLIFKDSTSTLFLPVGIAAGMLEGSGLVVWERVAVVGMRKGTQGGGVLGRCGGRGAGAVLLGVRKVS